MPSRRWVLKALSASSVFAISGGVTSEAPPQPAGLSQAGDHQQDEAAADDRDSGDDQPVGDSADPSADSSENTSEDDPEDTPTESEENGSDDRAEEGESDETGPEHTMDVTDYGATGDRSMDATSAIQAAFDDAEDGDTVYFPPGQYRVAENMEDSEAILRVPTDVQNLTVTGERGYGSSRIVVSEQRYRANRNLSLFHIQPDDVVEGLEISDLTIDGNRPNRGPLPSSTGIHFEHADTYAGGGNELLVEDCWLENFNGPAVRTRQDGVTLRRITAVDNFQNFGLSERDASTAGTSEYGVRLLDAVSKNADDVGIDHNQGGRLKVDGLYSENNGTGGLKSTKDNRRTRIQNATFQNENTVGVRTNISTTSDIPEPPIEISMDTVAIRNVNRGGIYLSGEDASVQNSALEGGPIEIRHCRGDVGGSEGGLTVHAASGGTVGELRVIGTTNGPGVWFNATHDLTIDSYYHADNQAGGVERDGSAGELTIRSRTNEDPGPLETPEEHEVGAWSDVAPGNVSQW